VEAAIAELHADARRADETDWNGIAALYETLMRIQPSPVAVPQVAGRHANASRAFPGGARKAKEGC
jgi:predicted RNA polymerase sigma factor